MKQNSLISNQSILNGDCLELAKKIPEKSVDLIYLDPPFFTQKTHALKTRKGNEKYEFSDKWISINDYLEFIKKRLEVLKPLLKPSGSLFLHCDKTASHYLKMVCDEIFGYENFQSEIIWTYKRWSNAKKGLLNNHQSILFYSKSINFKFNQEFEAYSPATNVDQIVQLRKRDSRNKSIYMRNESGQPILSTHKKGVPLGDVWDIPFLNPKALERVSYPTQKPILLLEKIIKLVTTENDIVLDPFCGSGTTLVAAKLLNRKYIGFDINKDAIRLTEARLKNPIKTNSKLLQNGRESYKKNDKVIDEILNSFKATVVHRNKGIDGLLSAKNKIIPIKIVTEISNLDKDMELLIKAAKKNNYAFKVLYCSQEINFKKYKAVEQKHNLLLVSNLKQFLLKIKKL